VNANQAAVSVRTMCRVLNVSASGYYAWCDRPPSQRAIDNAVLTERIRSVHAESDATYGMPRVRAELIDQGVVVSRQRVARLMRAAHIRGVSRRRAFVVTTRRDKDKQPAPDLVKREFKADGPNQLWVADMTYVPTWAGFIYLAVVLDVWSRRIVGWAIGESMTAELVLSALNMALQQRKPKDVIHHSDQGSQGEFNQSSQHVLSGGVDEGEEVEVGSIVAVQAALARKTAGAASRRAMAVLEGDRARTFQR
jgi:putative transposase